jgi:hypothetical protein
MNEYPTPESILQVGLGFWPSKILLSAVEMELFTDLAKGPQSLDRVRARNGLHPRAARDFLDALVALGFLLRRNGEYSNTPETDTFLDKHKPSYIGASLKWRTTASTATGITSRKPFEPACHRTKAATEACLCLRRFTPIQRA